MSLQHLHTLFLKYFYKVKVKQSLYRPVTGPEGSRRWRLPGFKTIGTLSWQRQPYAPTAFTPQEIFLVLISVSYGLEHRAIVQLKGYVHEKFQ